MEMVRMMMKMETTGMMVMLLSMEMMRWMVVKML